MTEIRFYIVGSGEEAIERFGDNPWKELNLLEEMTPGKIALALEGGSHSLPEIAEITGLPSEEVETHLDKLQQLNFVKKRKEEFHNLVPAFSSQTQRNIKETLSRTARKEAEKAKKILPHLKTSWKESLESKITWDAGAHLIIDDMALDNGFLHAVNQLERKSSFWDRRTKGQQALPAFWIERGPNFVNFGVNKPPFYGRIRIILLHGNLFPREREEFVLLQKEATKEILEQATSKGGIKAGKNEVKSSVLRKLTRKNVLKEKNGTFTLNIPSIPVNALSHLLTDLAQLATSTAKAVAGDFDKLLDIYKKLSHSKYLEGSGDFLELCYHTLMPLTIQTLTENGYLPALPEEINLSTGMGILRGKAERYERLCRELKKKIEANIA